MLNPLIQSAQRVIQIEARAISDLSNRLDGSFVKACGLIKACCGKVILIGMGKSGHIANKIAATFASTGTPAFAIHPAEAGHGDLGMIATTDVVVVISYSGESEEIITLMPTIQRLGVDIIGITGNAKSSIAGRCQVHLDVSVEQEACPHNLAPTSSTTATLAMGDALAVSLLTAKGFSADDFARSHPSGALGRKLLTFVKDVMKTGDAIPKVNTYTPLLEALLVMSEKALGVVFVVDAQGLQGVFTDGDLRRVLATQTKTQENIQHVLIGKVMTTHYQSISADQPAIAAVQIMDQHRINALPVTDGNQQIVGAINNHTLMQAKII